MVQIISSKNFVTEHESLLRELVKKKLPQKKNPPRLDVIIVGEHPASLSYVRKKKEGLERLGGVSFIHSISVDKKNESSLRKELMDLIDQLNNDGACHGILLQLPLPTFLAPHTEFLLNRIAAQKDVDGLTDYQQQQLYLGRPCLAPCTPLGMIHFLMKLKNPQLSLEKIFFYLYGHYFLEEKDTKKKDHQSILGLNGLSVLVMGRSALVGKPLVQLLCQRNATVTWGHSQSINLKELSQQSEVVISAVGKENLITKDWLMIGKNSEERIPWANQNENKNKNENENQNQNGIKQLFLDVGTNTSSDPSKMGKLVGDLDPQIKDVKNSDHVAMTPVPGGVGPLTVQTLFWNVVRQWLKSE